MRRLFFFLLLLPWLSKGQESVRVAEPGPVLMPIGENGRIDSTARAIQYLEKSIWRIGFLGPGLMNESRLGQQTTLVSQLRFVMSAASLTRHLSPNTSENYFAYTINPQLSGAVRQYYNFARRLAKGKSIRYNSGNYVSAKLIYTFGPLIEHTPGGLQPTDIQGATVQVMWGFQRTYRRNFYLNLEVGVGTTRYHTNPVSVASDFTLGYTFPNHHE